MATALETFTAGTETAVDVARVERQLCELWQLASESEGDKSLARRSSISSPTTRPTRIAITLRT